LGRSCGGLVRSFLLATTAIAFLASSTASSPPALLARLAWLATIFAFTRFRCLLISLGSLVPAAATTIASPAPTVAPAAVGVSLAALLALTGSGVALLPFFTLATFK